MLGARPKIASAVALALVAAALCLFPAAAAALAVTKTADSNDGTCNADCSLREAIEDTAEGGTVVVPASPAPYQVTDALGTLLIAKDLTIAGAGARTTEVTAPGTNVRVFSVEGTGLGVVDVAIRDLSVTGGDGGGAGQGAQGGGVLAFKGSGALTGPVLTLERVRVAGNRAATAGNQAVGGGIDADGKGTHLIVRESLVVGNQAIGTAGGEATAGGIATFASARATIENTTIAGNESIGQGKGAAAARAGGMIALNGSELINVTLFGNSTSRSDPFASPSRSGNLEAGDADDAILRNTIIAGGKAEVTATADCALDFTSKGGNVFGVGCKLGVGDAFSTAPLLGPLADNGGPTDTMALLAGSPALDTGVSCPAPAADQRGVVRPQGGRCDSGAFELEVIVDPPPPPGGKDFFCRNRKANVVGTGGKDRLVGTAGPDVIVAKGGADTILARGGNDLICAGPGKDMVKGGKGKDRLLGQAGRDVLRGGPGKDQLLGGAGKDLQVQ